MKPMDLRLKKSLIQRCRIPGENFFNKGSRDVSGLIFLLSENYAEQAIRQQRHNYRSDSNAEQDCRNGGF